ncbi:MAG: hypothetical protein LUF27_08035 [Lachnospiraceae bacterium]|nr:hypothetical protein [Lachnospiraceae bacterium]
MVTKKEKILTMAGVSAAAAAGCRILREYRSWHPFAFYWTKMHESAKIKSVTVQNWKTCSIFCLLGSGH